MTIVFLKKKKHLLQSVKEESFRWMSSFKWKSSSIFQMDGRKAKLGEFTFADLDNAVEWQNH